MRVVFLGSPPFATPVFDALLESAHDVACLVTRPDRPRGRGRAVEASPLVLRAREAGVEVRQPASTKDPAFAAGLAALEPEVLAVASYGEILRRDVLELAPHGALNVHGSLLPRWRGASPIQRAVQAGDAVTGVTIQRMVLALDAGDIQLTRELEIGPEDTSGDLFERLALLGAGALVDALDQLERGEARFTPQDPSLVTLAPKLKKEDGRIDFARSAAELGRHVRAMSPWPAARTLLPDGRELVVLSTRSAGADADAAPAGSVVGGSGPLVVACGAGGTQRLELVRVKPAGKGAMSGVDFLRGARLAAGTRLGDTP